MKFLTRNPGTITVLGAWSSSWSGGSLGAPMLLTFLVAFALIVLGAALVNGTYVLRRLVVVIPTLFLVTAFTFYLQNSRGDKRDLAFNILGPGATEAGVDAHRQGVPPRRADVHPLHAVVERCAPG